MTPEMIEYGKLPAVQISSDDGASATISLFGAHVLSWKSADGRERLFCSSQAVLDKSRPVRGGIPLIFPQFSMFGDGARHGFARIVDWALDEVGHDEHGAFAQFSLTQAGMPPAVAEQYPCRLLYRVQIGGNTLDLQLQVENCGTQEIRFTSALHSYLALDHIDQCKIHGLQGLSFSDMDKTPPQTAVQEDKVLTISHKVDRIFHAANADALSLQDGVHALHLQQTGFTDAVVWNPWQADAAALADLADDEYTRFVCIEPASSTPFVLDAGKTWVGTHRMTAGVISAEG